MARAGSRRWLNENCFRIDTKAILLSVDCCKIVFEIGETLFTEEFVVFWRKREQISALSLVAVKVSVLSGWELNQSSEVVLRVELEEWLKGGQSGEFNKASRRGSLVILRLRLKDFTPEDQLVLFVVT